MKVTFSTSYLIFPDYSRQRSAFSQTNEIQIAAFTQLVVWRSGDVMK